MPSLWKAVWTYFKKQKIELQYDPAITLMAIYPEKKKTVAQKIMHPNVHSSTTHNNLDTEATQVPITDDQFKKMQDMCVFMCIMEYYLATKRYEILPWHQHGWT